MSLARLHAAGHEVIGGGRSIRTAQRRFPYASWVEADFLRLDGAEAWLPLLHGIDAVVNCVGVLQDGWRDDVQRVQEAATGALFDACVRAGVRRVIHISAVGADPAGPSKFSRTKAAAEAHLQTLPVDWVILRPALVLAAAVYGGTAILRAIAAWPLFVPVAYAGARLQVVSVDDVSETVVRALALPAARQVVWEVAYPQPYALADIVTAIRNWLGFPPRRVLRVPDAVANLPEGSPIWSAGWAGAVRRARLRWRSLRRGWSAIPGRGLRRRASNRKAWTGFLRCGPRPCRIAGSRGFICSSRSPS